MGNSKALSMKHTHLFHCEDQTSQDHNSFVTREIPIQRLFNVEQYPNDSGDLQGFSFSEGMNVMEYDMPELVVFIQEDHQNFVKDICIDRGVSPECECLPKCCELDRNVLSSDSNLGTVEAVPIDSNETEDALKNYDCKNLMMEGEVEIDSGYKISTDQLTNKTSVTLREAFKTDEDFSRSCKNWQINSFLGTIGSREEFPHCAECVQVTDTIISTPEIGNTENLSCSSRRQIDFPQEISSSAVVPLSDPIPASSRASHQSNDSISSTHSFAFPILPEEWTGSPVRMLEADKSQSRKKQWRKIWFCCK